MSDDESDDRRPELPAAAFMVVQTFDALWRRFSADPKWVWPVYAWPLRGALPRTTRYRGLDRDPVSAWRHREAAMAQIRAEEIHDRDPGLFGITKWVDALSDDLLLEHADGREVLELAREEGGDFELIWARLEDSSSAPPDGWTQLGFDATYFPHGCFSAVCDSMCFPRWHGADPEGVALADHFARLNAHGLFRTAADAHAFLEHYESFPWAETGPYRIAEVFAPPELFR